jgi:hypothetical protein
LGRRDVLHGLGEHLENRSLRLGAHLAESIRFILVFQEALDFGHERLRWLQLRLFDNLALPLDCLPVVSRLERYDAPPTTYLFSEPIEFAAQIDASDGRFLSNLVARFLRGVGCGMATLTADHFTGIRGLYQPPSLRPDVRPDVAADAFRRAFFDRQILMQDRLAINVSTLVPRRKGLVSLSLCMICNRCVRGTQKLPHR